MHRSSLLAFLTLLLFSASMWAQNACDLNQNGTVNVVDVQLSVNKLSPCTGVCNSTLMQQVVGQIADAALGGACLQHTVSLQWTPSTSTNVVGYNVYRATTSGGAYTKVNSTPIAGVIYLDIAVQSGQTYYYRTTAVDSNNNESGYSNTATAAVPTSS
jgi:hypothetical protein